jgi:hypothetical protein
MAVYTVHEPPRLTGDATADADRFVFVRDGFYGWAFLLTPLWMLWNRLWLVLLGYVVLLVVLQNFLFALGVSGSVRITVSLLVSVLVGTEAATLRRFTLTRRRYRNVGVVVGDDLENAERRFFATWDVTRAVPRAQSPGGPSAPFAPEPRTPQAAAAGSASDVIGLFPQPGASR